MSTPPLPDTQEFPVAAAAPAPPRDPVWTGWDVLMLAGCTAIALFGITVVVIAGAMQLPAFHGVPPEQLGQNAKIVVPIQAGAYLVLVAAMYALLKFYYKVDFAEAVRWRWQAIAPRALGYLLGGVLLAFTIQLASTWLPIPKSLPIERFFRDAASAYLLAAFGILIAPAVEELFFRGFLYPVLARRLGQAAAVVLTAAPFALMHAPQLANAWAPMLLLFVVGLSLTLVRARSASVAASFLMHAGYNFTLFLLFFVQTGGFRRFPGAG